MPGFKLSKHITNTTLCNTTTNSSKTESKLSSLLKYMFPALLEVNSLPATIQKFTHLCDIQTTRMLKKNRQEQTQLLKREKARLSSVALISIQCFSEEIFISKDQAGQESNRTQTHTCRVKLLFLSGRQAGDGHLTWQGQIGSQRNTHIQGC